ELQTFHRTVDTQARSATEHIQKHHDRIHIEAGLRGAFPDKAMFSDFITALAEVPNPGEVLAHIGLNKQDRDTLRSSPHWQAIRSAIHQISKGLLPKPKELAPRPRAPKPPSEVGGRGTTPVDESLEAIRAGDFRAFEAAER